MSETTFSLDVPAEPDPLAVVLDRNGLAWQRLGGKWVRNAAVIMFMTPVKDGLNWVSLLAQHGPVTLLHPGTQQVK